MFNGLPFTDYIPGNDTTVLGTIVRSKFQQFNTKRLLDASLVGRHLYFDLSLPSRLKKYLKSIIESDRFVVKMVQGMRSR
mgnify:CR=1 FL=1